MARTVAERRAKCCVGGVTVSSGSGLCLFDIAKTSLLWNVREYCDVTKEKMNVWTRHFVCTQQQF